jgi:hypothetical protein
MTLSTFPTFLTFQTRKLAPTPVHAPWEGLEIPLYPRRLPPTVEPKGDALTGRPESASEYTMLPRRPLPDRRSHASGS